MRTGYRGVQKGRSAMANDKETVVIRYQLIAAVTAMSIMIFVGTLVYHLIERWTWISSFYFSVVTLTTVGYGDLVPTRDVTRLFTAIYILLGATIVLASVAIIGTRYLEKRGVKVKSRREKRHENKSRKNDAGGPLA
jgi:voltage-gated potassium channel